MLLRSFLSILLSLSASFASSLPLFLSPLETIRNKYGRTREKELEKSTSYSLVDLKGKRVVVFVPLYLSFFLRLRLALFSSNDHELGRKRTLREQERKIRELFSR